ncbi:DUF7793 family protein [Arthrobacter sp. 131MFCol6.1]|uniref:DUF7793 family protein n=1 Tax=Arthrobacter sp. 131MFCol6.1 TaxID=1157944 RepID=UPI00035F3D46|nr:STAS/SEC14 domain-containing protein [Arthrobacter sp. 131MFCol6.1]
MMQGPIDAADGKNSLSVDAGILKSLWRPGSFVDADDARDAMLAVDRISGGTPMPMLSEMTDVEFSAAARYQFAQSRGVVAIAVLGSSTVDRVIASATSRETKYPHEFFTSRTDAIAWLQEVIQSRD